MSAPYDQDLEGDPTPAYGTERPPAAACPKGCPRDEFAGALVCRYPYTCPIGVQP